MSKNLARTRLFEICPFCLELSYFLIRSVVCNKHLFSLKHIFLPDIIRRLLRYCLIVSLSRAVFSFLNLGVFVVIAKLPKAEIRLCPFPEPSNSGGALAPTAPPLNTALMRDGFLLRRQISLR